MALDPLAAPSWGEVGGGRHLTARGGLLFIDPDKDAIEINCSLDWQAQAGGCTRGNVYVYI
jgi:hypothetical protein